MGTPARLTLGEGGTWGRGGERDLGTQTEPTLRPQHVQSVLSPTSVMGDGGGQPRRKGGPDARNTAAQGQGCQQKVLPAGRPAYVGRCGEQPRDTVGRA